MKEIIETLSLHVSDETVHKAILKLGYVYKKKSLHTSGQERPRCQGKEENWGRLMSEYDETIWSFLMKAV